MKKGLTILMLVLSAGVYGQQRDTTVKKESGHERMRKDISKRLKVDSAKAERVNAVQEDYKAGIKRVMSEKGLTETGRRMAVDSVMRDKNRKLGKMLTAEQQEQMIPSAERHKGKMDKKKTGTSGQ